MTKPRCKRCNCKIGAKNYFYDRITKDHWHKKCHHSIKKIKPIPVGSWFENNMAWGVIS